nr:MAG: hypothetical protein [uncultured cyanophage]WFD61443.1 MAG: hypothetical protein [uncultured cyanophage]
MLEELMSEDSTETITLAYVASQIAKIQHYSDQGRVQEIIDNAKSRIASHASISQEFDLTEEEKKAVDQLIKEFTEKFPELINERLSYLRRQV